MEQFTIQQNEYLNRQIQGFYHADYEGGGGKWKEAGTIENIICTLKNDITPYSPSVLQDAKQQLTKILGQDLPKILQITELVNLTVCVIPRAKANYNANQLLFRATISEVVNHLSGFSNGTNYIVRHTNTRTTHLNKSGNGGDGDLPYSGITNNTCSIDDNVRGKDILLIDDLYTQTINIDEDAIQALLDKGARSVVFYAVGKTMYNNNPQGDYKVEYLELTFRSFESSKYGEFVNISGNIIYHSSVIEEVVSKHQFDALNCNKYLNQNSHVYKCQIAAILKGRNQWHFREIVPVNFKDIPQDVIDKNKAEMAMEGVMKMFEEFTGKKYNPETATAEDKEWWDYCTSTWQK
jgi:hypoxanthine-guanine phosphoribosyltransferase